MDLKWRMCVYLEILETYRMNVRVSLLKLMNRCIYAVTGYIFAIE